MAQVLRAGISGDFGLFGSNQIGFGITDRIGNFAPEAGHPRLTTGRGMIQDGKRLICP